MRIGRPRNGTIALLSIALLFSLGCEPAPSLGRRVADGRVADTTDSTFVRDVIAPMRPTVVYYWAHGCLPCLAAGPAVKRVAARYAGRVTFWKMNMGWSARRVRLYDVRGWPTIVFYVGRREQARMVGVPARAAEDSITAFVELGLERVQAGIAAR